MTDLFDFQTFPILTTERLILRQITHDDAHAMQVLFSSLEVLQFLNNPPTDTHEKAIGMIDWFAANYRAHTGVDWAITERGDDRTVGMCGLYGWERENQHIDLGYHLMPSHWGQGYATEATRAIIAWGFANLGLHRVQADCTEGHIASERVMLKCGFKHEGTWRESCWEHGRWVNIKQFGLLRDEFTGGTVVE